MWPAAVIPMAIKRDRGLRAFLSDITKKPRQTRYNRRRRLMVTQPADSNFCALARSAATSDTESTSSGRDYELPAEDNCSYSSSNDHTTGVNIDHELEASIEVEEVASSAGPSSSSALYPGSRISLEASQLVLMSYMSHHHLSGQSKQDLLGVFYRALVPYPHQCIYSRSNHNRASYALLLQQLLHSHESRKSIVYK